MPTPFHPTSTSTSTATATTTTTTIDSNSKHHQLEHQWQHQDHQQHHHHQHQSNPRKRGASELLPLPEPAHGRTSVMLKKRKYRSSYVVNAANCRLRRTDLDLLSTSSPTAKPTSTPEAIPASPYSQLPDAAMSSDRPMKDMPQHNHHQHHQQHPPPPPPQHTRPRLPLPLRNEQTHGQGQGLKRKGLRHFAVRVCKKVEEKGVTTYNEVADELVNEERVCRQQEQAANETQQQHQHPQSDALEIENGSTTKPKGKGKGAAKGKGKERMFLVDEKNIRRRVYDSLNVLMAMGILAKDKKQISWQGIDMLLHGSGGAGSGTGSSRIRKKSQFNNINNNNNNPSSSSSSSSCSTSSTSSSPTPATPADLNEIRELIYQRRKKIAQKQADAAKLRDQVDRMAALVRHRSLQHQRGQGAAPSKRMLPPFMIVRADSDAHIDLTMTHTRDEICFTFDSRFGLFDHCEIMRRLPWLQKIVDETRGEDDADIDIDVDIGNGSGEGEGEPMDDGRSYDTYQQQQVQQQHRHRHHQQQQQQYHQHIRQHPADY